MAKRILALMAACVVLMGLTWSRPKREPPPFAPVTGIYDLLPTNEIAAGEELANPNVAGVSARFRWNSIQPNKLRTYWAAIDNVIDSAKSYGKKTIILVIPGINTPNWVYSDGAQYVTFTYEGKNFKMPVPWDPIYLQKWCQFVTNLGKRYANNPDVISVQMAGVGKVGEMGIEVEGVDWTQYGYTDDVYISAWKTVIDTFRQAFPNKVTHLSIKEPFRGRTEALLGVLNYCLTTYPKKIHIQANDLRETGSDMSDYIRQAGEQTYTGYEMFGGREWLDAITGDRMSAFQAGLADGVVYMEVYQGDLQDPTLNDAVQFLAEGLAANAAKQP